MQPAGRVFLADGRAAKFTQSGFLESKTRAPKLMSWPLRKEPLVQASGILFCFGDTRKSLALNRKYSKTIGGVTPSASRSSPKNEKF